jgi:WXXGXW repeat (2 copies)
MKNLLLILVIAAGCLAATGCTVDGYAETQPADVVYDQGVAPGPDYVWIDGDWVWGGGRYSWRNGHWDHGRAGHVYHRGSWAHTSRGYHWNRGGWK